MGQEDGEHRAYHRRDQKRADKHHGHGLVEHAVSCPGGRAVLHHELGEQGGTDSEHPDGDHGGGCRGHHQGDQRDARSDAA